MQSTKLAIRRAMIQRRAAADPVWRAEASSRILALALDLPVYSRARSVCAFIGSRDEVQTAPLISSLIQFKGFAIVPCVMDDGMLTLYRVRDFPEGFRPGAFGILEPDHRLRREPMPPDDLDLIFVPGVAFDRKGRRLGYGKGFFDRLLADAPSVHRIGLGFSFQVVEDLPEEEHDERLDGVLTEEGLIEFQGGI